MDRKVKVLLHQAVIKYASLAALVLACLFLLSALAVPVLEQLDKVASAFNYTFRYSASDSVRGLAMLCVAIIAVIGFIRVMKR